MIRACSWCKNIIGTKPTDDRAMDGETTHSICLGCKDTFVLKLAETKKELEKKGIRA